MSQVFDRVKEIIVEQLDVEEDKVTMEASFREDLEADSLDVVELVMELEDEFDLEIADEEAEKINTVGDAVNFIDRKSTRLNSSHVASSYAVFCLKKKKKNE